MAATARLTALGEAASWMGKFTMSTHRQEGESETYLAASPRLKVLTEAQVRQIDEELDRVLKLSDYAEMTIWCQHGHVRFYGALPRRPLDEAER
jgi:hypothetical protein